MNDYNLDFNWKGITIKYNNNRYNLINPNFKLVLQLRGNENTELSRYFRLYKDNKINLYLQYYPVKIKDYNNYNYKLNKIINNLNYLYSSIFITKQNNKSIIPFELSPCINELHNIYKSTNTKINMNIIKEYFKSLPINKLCFIFNYNKK